MQELEDRDDLAQLPDDVRADPPPVASLARLDGRERRVAPDATVLLPAGPHVGAVVDVRVVVGQVLLELDNDAVARNQDELETRLELGWGKAERIHICVGETQPS